MTEPQRLSDEIYAQVYGQYAPRACVDMVVIGLSDTVSVKINTDLSNIFTVEGPCGIVLSKRDILPEIGNFHLPGGAIRKGETIEAAANRIIRSEAGIEVDILQVIGSMEFPQEEREVSINGKVEKIIVHSLSIVLLVRAKTQELVGSNEGETIGWFHTPPEKMHSTHLSFLLKHGFLNELK